MEDAMKAGKILAAGLALLLVFAAADVFASSGQDTGGGDNSPLGY
jgi:hypothetical protein